MARLKIERPSKADYSCLLEVRITDMNYGGHVGNDRFLSYLHEARVCWLSSLGYSELDIEGVGLVMNEAMLQYKNQLFYPDKIRCDVTVTEISRMGFELVYHLWSEKQQKTILLGQTGQVFYDYREKKLAKTPQAFKQRFA
ncbi:MAG TPA: thioesterase [Caldithrix abyssi]|uniref:Thioesterase n=1 Tax=Caldithrix abyssi TaxID=187145 RepID=A0A7V1LNC8_CALAY|nr:thioesterase [Caldithrix abyssi]